MPISEFKRTLSATVKAALHTGDGPYSVEVDGCVVTFTREQGLNWR
jgi:hypothetical protein